MWHPGFWRVQLTICRESILSTLRTVPTATWLQNLLPNSSSPNPPKPQPMPFLADQQLKPHPSAYLFTTGTQRCLSLLLHFLMHSEELAASEPHCN